MEKPKDMLRQYLKTGDKVCIYGTGLAAQMGCVSLEKLSIICECFIDDDAKKWGTTLCGKEIKGLREISFDRQIFIMANPEYQIHERLKQAGFTKWVYMDPEILKEYRTGYFAEIQNKLRKNQGIIRKCYNMLADDMSRKVFEYILLHRMSHRLDLIEKIFDNGQYFGNDLIRKISGNIVDCGAYTGDTLTRFLKQLEKQDGYQYYAFEAEKKNYNAIRDLCEKENLRQVRAYNLAVWDKCEELFFENDSNVEKVGGKVLETACGVERIMADSLDNVLEDVDVNIIMMDIEGAEIKALYGAEKLIKRNHPKLAISAYHKLEHLWEIPLLIKDLCDDYQIYFRHHRWNRDDTVCYGIPRGNIN